MCVRVVSGAAWVLADDSATGEAARRGGAGAAAIEAMAATAAAGGAATGISAADLGSYFRVRFKRTSLTIALSVSCTPIPVVATDS
jgi:hypothetical protein